MKTAVLFGIALTSAVTTSAQAPVTPPPHTTTLTGCVTGGTKSRPITLLNALVLPLGTATPAPPGTVPDAARETATGTSGAVGTAGTVRGTAPAGSSASSLSGYRLSGADMSAWIGRRVEVVGTLVSSPTASSAAPVGTTGTLGKTDTLPIPEFRVVSVQPITGACPAR
jgi:hypothetical protein